VFLNETKTLHDVVLSEDKLWQTEQLLSITRFGVCLVLIVSLGNLSVFGLQSYAQHLNHTLSSAHYFFYGLSSLSMLWLSFVVNYFILHPTQLLPRLRLTLGIQLLSFILTIGQRPDVDEVFLLATILSLQLFQLSLLLFWYRQVFRRQLTIFTNTQLLSEHREQMYSFVLHVCHQDINCLAYVAEIVSRRSFLTLGEIEQLGAYVQRSWKSEDTSRVNSDFSHVYSELLDDCAEYLITLPE
jgi:hypothetical protein